jgi:hypothetical protein
MIFLGTFVLTLAACKAVPVDHNRGELIASEGVKAIFEETEEGDEIRVTRGDNIRCERQRRVGTHLINKVCMTKDEWDLRERKTRDVTRRFREGRPCVDCGGDG